MTAKSTAVIVAGIVALSVFTFGLAGAAPADIVAQQDTPETPTDNETETETDDGMGEETETPEADGEADTAADGNETDNETAVEAANVTFEDQTSDGTEIQVASAELPEGGFLVAYNRTMAAPMGNSSFVESGEQEDVNVTLEQELTENETVIVAAFEDTDGSEQFELGTDEVYVDEEQGQPVLAAAMVNVSDGAGNETDAGDEETETPTDDNDTDTSDNDTDTTAGDNETDTGDEETPEEETPEEGTPEEGTPEEGEDDDPGIL